MIEHSRIEEAVQAREELKDHLATLGAAVTENIKVSAKNVVSETIGVAEDRVKIALDQVDPRNFIREKPMISLAGAFITGLLVASRRTSIYRIPGHPIFAALALVGVDLLRAYALTRINRVPEGGIVPVRPLRVN